MGGHLLQGVRRGDERDRFLQAWEARNLLRAKQNGHNVTQPNLWSPAACPLLNPARLPLPSRAGRLVSSWGRRKRDRLSLCQLQLGVGDLPVHAEQSASSQQVLLYLLGWIEEHFSSQHFFLDEVLWCHSQLAVCPSFCFCDLEMSYRRVLQPCHPCWV